jgi:hypothetical protein
MAVSEVAFIRESIEVAYMAAQWGLTGLALGTSQHRFITARMERIEEGRQELQTLIGEQAIGMVAETLQNVPEKPTRYDIEKVLWHELGNTEKTAHLLDYLKEAWETLDLLTERFGIEDARKMIIVSSSFLLETAESVEQGV